MATRAVVSTPTGISSVTHHKGEQRFLLFSWAVQAMCQVNERIWWSVRQLVIQQLSGLVSFPWDNIGFHTDNINKRKAHS